MALKKSILFLVFLFLSISTYFICGYIKKDKLSFYKDLIFENTKRDIIRNFHTVNNNFTLETFNRSKKIIENLNIYEYLKKPYKDFNYFSSENTILRIYDENTNLLYTNSNFKDRTNINRKISNMIKRPQYDHLYTASAEGFTLSHIFPIFNGELIGMVQLDYQLDRIAKELEKSAIKSMILLNEELSKQVDLNLSYSRNFIKERYVVNKNADKYYQKIVEQNRIIGSKEKSLVNEIDGVIIVKQEIKSSSGNKADLFLTKPIDLIDTSSLDFINSLFNIITFTLIFIYGLFIYFIYSSYRNKEYILQNKKLLTENKELREVSDKLDYNEKKLSNLFNLQPNVMFISNGVDIVQVNRRFMGFFRRYKTFENFKRNHKDISELFEACDKPNYINDELIEGKYWLEYILENPKRLYKTVMSVDNEPHHFIIKVNEMDYVKNFQERYIVVAFVDITLDIESRSNGLQEKKDIEDNFDISYILENTMTLTIKEFTNITPTRQTIFKAQEADLDTASNISIDINISNQELKLSWVIVIPSTTVSFIVNQITSNYDQKPNQALDKDSIQVATNVINALLNHFMENLNGINHPELSASSFDIVDTNILEDQNRPLETINMYRFIMFAEDQELDIYIKFDDKSMKYFKQIVMLGMFFDTQ